MRDRRHALIRMGLGAWAIPGLLAVARSAAAQLSGGPQSAMPPIRGPVLFNTPEADRILEALPIFPPDNPWNQDVSEWPVHPNSRNIIAAIGADQPLRYNPGMNFVLVPPDQRRIPVKVTGYPGESDQGPFPVPENMPVEGWSSPEQIDPRLRGLTLDDYQRDRTNLGGDRHAIVVDPVNRILYEFFGTRKTDTGWEAAQASVFDLKSNRLRPEGWTSADAAGLPIFPAVVRHDELRRGVVRHALRVTIQKTRRAYVSPARHYASANDDPNLPRMGERIRLRRDFDISHFSFPVRTILSAMQRHGMLVADNGINWAFDATSDPRIPILHEELRRVKGAAFEVVQRPLTKD